MKSFLKGLNIFMAKDFDRYGVGREIVSLSEISVKKRTFVPTVLDAKQVNYLIRYALDFEMRELRWLISFWGAFAEVCAVANN